MKKRFAVLLTALFFSLGSAYADIPAILVYDGGGSQSEIEAAVIDLGYDYDLSTPTPGKRLLDLTLSNYEAVVIGWNWDGDTTGIANPSDGNALDAIDGNIILTGHDAGKHVVHGYDFGTGGDAVDAAATTFLSQAIDWAIAAPGTGLVALGDYSTAFSYLPAAWSISATGGVNRDKVFGPTVAGAGSGVYTGLTAAHMSNWGHSYHARFDGWDTSRFVVFEVGEFGDIVTIAAPYQPEPPEAAFTWTPEPQAEGSPVAFTDTSTSSPDDIVAWSWDFAGLVTSTLQNPSLTFHDDGIYTVTLTVTDDWDGLTDSVSHDVTITDLIPSAAFDWTPKPQAEGSAVDFIDTSTSSPDDIVAWSWDFAGLGTSTLQNPTFTFDDDGVYSVTLTVTDDDGSTDSVSHDVTITDLIPSAAFSSAPEPQDEGSPVAFTDDSTSSPDAIVAWSWDFGDSVGMGTSTAQNPSYTYMDDGTYTVALTVTDDDGSTDTIQHSVTVNNVAPSVDAGPDAEINEGATFSSSGYFTDPGGDTWTATVDYGDGTGEQELALNPDKTFSLSHVYADNGIYTVTLTVTDDDGGTGTDTLTVTVLEPPGECEGKVTELTLQYNGTTVDAQVRVEQKQGKKKIVVFDDTVQPGGQFTFTGQDKQGTLGPEITIYVNDVENTKIHTSCSQPIATGMIFGDFEIIAGESRHGGPLP